MDIMVVAPDEYADIARKLVHIISSKDNYSSACWTIKKYKDNEQTIRGSQYVIFLGNEDQNELTKDYLQVINLEHDKGGVCYGFDGTKAVVFGTGESKEDFVEFIKDNAKTLLLPLKIYFWWLTFPYITIKRYRKIKQLKKDQTTLGVDLFMKNCFDEWVATKE